MLSDRLSFEIAALMNPPINRADIAELFKNARACLLDGRATNICHAVRIGTPGKSSQGAIDVVRSRMGDRNTLEDWLYKRGHITYTELVGYAPGFKALMLQYRINWLTELVKEYSQP